MIVFNNWQISCTGVIAQQYDNLTRKIEVVGKLPEGYEWSLLVQCNGNKDTLHMERTENGAEVILSQDNLSVSGYYQLQLRGNLIEDIKKTRHTNVTKTFVPASLVGTGGWPDVPSEFLQIEQRILEAAEAAEKAAEAAEEAAKEAQEAAAGGADFCTEEEAKAFADAAERNAKAYADQQITAAVGVAIGGSY